MTSFIYENQNELLADFKEMFATHIQAEPRNWINSFCQNNKDSQLARTILDALKEQQKNFSNLKQEYQRVDTQATQLSQKKVRDEATEEELRDLNTEKSALGCLLRDIAEKLTLSFFTDEGLLPNYAFPEAGVRLKSVIWRRKKKIETAFETFSMSLNALLVVYVNLHPSLNLAGQEK